MTALWSEMELDKAEFGIAWGETVMLTCADAEHRNWEVHVLDLGDALNAWKTHYESAHTTPEGTA